MTITACSADADVPIADATIGATVTHPDGITIDGVARTARHAVLRRARRWPLSGAFVVTTPGFYNIVVLPSADDPACTRLAQLLVTVTASATALTARFADHGVDTNADGLFDELIIDVGGGRRPRRTYRVVGTLTDGAGTAITRLATEQELRPALRLVSLGFDGARLFALGYDGAYGVENIALEETASSLALSSPASYTTSIYAHTQFQRPRAFSPGVPAITAFRQTPRVVPYEQLSVAVEVDTLAAAPSRRGRLSSAKTGPSSFGPHVRGAAGRRQPGGVPLSGQADLSERQGWSVYAASLQSLGRWTRRCVSRGSSPHAVVRAGAISPRVRASRWAAR